MMDVVCKDKNVKTDNNGLKNRLKNPDLFTKHISSVTKVCFAIKADKNALSQIERFLLKQKKINSIHKLEFGFDFLCEGDFLNCADAERFFIALFSNFKINNFEKFYVYKTKKCV